MRLRCSTFFFLLLAGLLTAAAACEGSSASSVPPPRRAPHAAVPSDSTDLLLVNRTDRPLLYKAFHPMMARPLPSQVEVDLSAPPPELVWPDSAAALWSRGALDQHEGYTLHLYRIAPPGSDSLAVARLSRSVTMDRALLDSLRQSGQYVVTAL